MARSIAIVEDEYAIAANYRDALVRIGFKVDIYGDRQSASDAFSSRLPDLVIIDVGLRDEVEGGYHLCRDLRARSAQLPIIFLTARDSELDIVSGLRLGADDYLSKNVSQSQLVARILALFRRSDIAAEVSEDDAGTLVRGALILDMDRMRVQWRGELLNLTVTELWILQSLARHPGHVRNRQQLMDAANVVLDDNTITSHIKRIRRKFLAVDPDFNGIETVYAMGYRWVAHSAESSD